MVEAAPPSILLTIAESVATLTFNRPASLNAFDRAMHRNLRAALDAIEADKTVRCLVLTGTGKAFCAGQDLAERAGDFAGGTAPDLGESLADNYNPLVRRLAKLPFPVIAAVNGTAAGAGAGLAIGCDIVLAAQSARFHFSFVKVGLGPDCGASWLLPRLVGQSRALAIALTGATIGAEEAQRIGLVWQTVPDAQLAATAATLALGFAAAPGPAVAQIKHNIRAAVTMSLDDALDRERDGQRQLGYHPHYREAVSAFTAKRTPNFTPADLPAKEPS